MAIPMHELVCMSGFPYTLMGKNLLGSGIMMVSRKGTEHSGLDVTNICITRPYPYK